MWHHVLVFGLPRVHLIASVPGAHTSSSMHQWGHMKLRKVPEGTVGCGSGGCGCGLKWIGRLGAQSAWTSGIQS